MKSGVDLLFEAAVCGAIPLMRPLRESLAGDRISRVIGIVNGTTNFILTRMTEGGDSFADALAEAQALGYAERDPTADVEGFDAAAKAAIIASVAFGIDVRAGDVYREGITGVTTDDIAMAARLGYVVKLLAVADSVPGPGGDQVAVRVHPAMVPVDHPLAAVREAYNAVFVQGDAAGELMFYGRGAGGRPTASAVLGDVVDAASNLRQGTSASAGVAGLATARLRPMDELESQYYLSLDVADKPGVLERVAHAFSQHGVSIVQVLQLGMGDEARLMLVTHTARERDMQATVADLRRARRGRPGGLAPPGHRARVAEIVARPGLARADRGVPRVPAGDGRHARHHPARRAPRPWCRRPGCRSGWAPRCGSRWRGPTPPARSRTGA